MPGQYSSDGKRRLGRIAKAGDADLRSLLVLGARAVLAAAKNKTDSISTWAVELEQTEWSPAERFASGSVRWPPSANLHNKAVCRLVVCSLSRPSFISRRQI